MATITHEYVAAKAEVTAKFSSLKDGAVVRLDNGRKGAKLGSKVVRPRTQVADPELVAPAKSALVTVVGHAIVLDASARPSAKLAAIIAAKAVKPAPANKLSAAKIKRVAELLDMTVAQAKALLVA